MTGGFRAPKILPSLPTLNKKENPVTHLKIAPGPVTAPGIDVSHYEPQVDWHKVAIGGYKFSIAKATDGLTGVDPLFRSHRAGARNAGLVTGTYHFFRYNIDPVNQAHHLLATTGGVWTNELPPILDVEWSKPEAIESINGHEDNVLKCLAELKRLTGVTPIVYTAFGFFDGAKDPGRFAEFPLWIANYHTEAPLVPAPWKSWVMWQKTEDDIVNGIGKCDVSVFNGSEEQLKALTKQ